MYRKNRYSHMGLGIDAIQNLFIKPITEREAGGVNRVSKQPAQFGTFKGVESGIAAINTEVTPKYLDSAASGSTYTNGIGYSEFGGFKPYLA